MKRFLCLLLCAAALLTLAPRAAEAVPAPNPLIRIGLAAGTKALPAASLELLTGDGYEFGYLNANMEFIPLGTTNEKKITITKNRNVYLSNGTYNDTSGNDVVGAFHDRLGGPYSTRAEAEDAVVSLSAQGISAFLSFSAGSWLVNSGSYTGSGGGTRWTGSKYCVSVVRTGTVDIIFQFDYNETFSFCVRPFTASGDNAITRFGNYRYNGMFEFRRFDGNNLYVYNAIDMQGYIKGVIPYEMSNTWPLEALKAQAVSARSFASYNMGRHKNAGYDICTDEHCQVYYGTAQANAVTNQAVDETYGKLLTYNGAVCETVYHASDGGATENSENVWVQAVPYLRGVVDPYEDASLISNYTWQSTVTNAQLSAILTLRGVAHNGVSNFYIEKTTDMGNVYSVTFIDNNGNKITSFNKENARILLNSPSNGLTVKSMRYTVVPGNTVLAAMSAGGAIQYVTDLSKLYTIGAGGEVRPLDLSASLTLISGNGALTSLPTQSTGASDSYTVIGRGSGHNLGMSQQGARGMANKGFTYDQILKFYFTGTEITTAG